MDLTFKDYVDQLVDLGNTIVVPVIFALVFVVFIWGVAKYFILGGGNEEDREKGRQFVLWGVLGMAVLFSVWGVINLLLSTLGFAE